ncbi:hypothetical protein TNCV_3433291 [Trichonephila clavipes]|nr:hypothetical protein TNCV_3433291 [Trichonephila clavipes]
MNYKRDKHSKQSPLCKREHLLILFTEQCLLPSTFGEDHIISRYFNHTWPSSMHDLTSCDFWLWGFLKSKVYRDQPASLEALKDVICQNVSAITQEMLLNAEVQLVVHHSQ